MSNEAPSEPAFAEDATADSEAKESTAKSTSLAWLVIAGILFVLLHGWALITLWNHGPTGRQLILICVYGGVLAGSALLTRRFPPPLAPSLILFGVVLGWWWVFVRA